MATSSSSNTAAWGVIQVSIAVVQSIICLGCLSYAVYIRCTIPKRRWPVDQRLTSKLIPFCTLCGLISFLASSLGMACFSYAFNITHHLDIAIVEFRLIKFFWSSGQFFSYCVFLLRLVETFHESTYRVSRLSIILLSILLIFYQIAWTIKCFIPFTFWSQAVQISTLGSHFSHSILSQLEVYSNILILFLDLLITISMTYMFVTRLFMVMRAQSETVRDRQCRIDVLNQSLNAEGANHQFLHLSTKITVLSTVSLMSSFAFMTYNAVTIYFDSNMLMVYLVHLGLQVDILISSFCLMLFLSRTEKAYTILCHCLSMKIEKCMKRALLERVSVSGSSSSSQSKSITSIGIPSGPYSNMRDETVLMKSELESSHEPYPLKFLV